MGFSAKQLQALRRPLDSRQIRTREAHGRELSYIEGWFAISEANRIFGFDAWSRETIETRCVLARETRGTFLAIYIAKVRITVQVAGATVIREGHGSGEGRGTSPGEVHDMPLKLQRPMPANGHVATFGKPFGLELYRQSRTATSPSPPYSRPRPQSKQRAMAFIPTTPRPFHDRRVTTDAGNLPRPMTTIEQQHPRPIRQNQLLLLPLLLRSHRRSQIPPPPGSSQPRSSQTSNQAGSTKVV